MSDWGLIPISPRDKDWVDASLNRYGYVLAPGVSELDSTPFFQLRRNAGWRTGDRCAFSLFQARPDGVYDAHLLCDQPWRGAMAVEFSRRSVAALFTGRPAKCITATIPLENRASRRVCRATGGIPVADTVDPLGRPCKIYRLERARWVQFSAALRRV